MDLVVIGLLGGLITGISPCILPVLPVVFLTGGAQSARFDSGDPESPGTASRRRPYLVIAGLVTSFTLVTLVCGTIPILSFWAERRATRRVRTQMAGPVTVS